MSNALFPVLLQSGCSLRHFSISLLFFLMFSNLPLESDRPQFPHLSDSRRHTLETSQTNRHIHNNGNQFSSTKQKHLERLHAPGFPHKALILILFPQDAFGNHFVLQSKCYFSSLLWRLSRLKLLYSYTTNLLSRCNFRDLRKGALDTIFCRIKSVLFPLSAIQVHILRWCLGNSRMEFQSWVCHRGLRQTFSCTCHSLVFLQAAVI